MIDWGTWKKGWAMLDGRERRSALVVLGIVIVSAFSSVGMVGSVMPFLAVLADPARIETTPALAWTYSTFGFSSTYGFLVALGVGSLVVILLSNAIQIVRTYAVARFATMRVHALASRLLGTYLRQPYEFFLDHHSGDMGTNILGETGAAVQQFYRPATELVAAALTASAIIVFLFWVDSTVAVVAFAVLGGLYAGIFLLIRRLLDRLGQRRVQANRARFRIANEALGGIKDIKLVGREGSYIDRFARPSQRFAQTQARVAVLSQTPRFVLQTVAFGGMIVLCLMLLTPASFETGTALGGILPTLGVFAFAGQRLMPELQKIYVGISQLRFGKASVDAIYEDLVGRAVAGELPRHTPEPLGLRENLQLEGVSYRYPNAEQAGLSDISMEIAAGEKIGVVGSSGAGKTTLADILLGLLIPQSGRILIDGTALEPDTLRAWLQSVGYVPQDIFLTDASVAENIAFGVPLGEIDSDRVTEAARIAQLDDFVRSELPEGYETPVGERGVRLSGGQRQRIGIARALYHAADFIVFDEATSALDNLTEREAMEAINALPGDKTILMIAHRLSTVKICDRIAVLEKGRLVGFGTWDELMTQNSVFRRIAQLGEVA